jgi:hypothetical protein
MICGSFGAVWGTASLPSVSAPDCANDNDNDVCMLGGRDVRSAGPQSRDGRVKRAACERWIRVLGGSVGKQEKPQLFPPLVPFLGALPVQRTNGGSARQGRGMGQEGVQRWVE